MKTLHLFFFLALCCLFCIGCQQNALTVRVGKDCYTSELQSKIQASGWKSEYGPSGSIDRAARKAFELKRVCFRCGKDSYYLYYHNRTKQIVAIVREEFEITSYRGDVPLIASSTEFTDKARFSQYDTDPEIEAYLKTNASHASQYGLGSLHGGWADVFLSVACKKFHDAEMEHAGKSVYEGVFAPEK